MANPGWVAQQMNRMASGINSGKTRKRAVSSARSVGADEAELAAAAEARGWRMAQIGADYVFAPRNYVIRPIP